jgi:hypothetical protein
LFFNLYFKLKVKRIHYSVGVTIVLLAVYRLFSINSFEIAWDVLGYYLPLPALFIYNDFFLNDITWLKELNANNELSGTLYMISELPSGQNIYFFLFGMSFFYAPFFFIGHFFATVFGFETNGFSTPYQVSLVVGGIVYMAIGLIYFYENLKHFLPEKIAILCLLCVVFGTNYIHHLSLKNLEPVTVLFLLVNIILYYSFLWHKNQKRTYIIYIAIAFSLMALTKPSEVFILLVPVLYGIYNWQSLLAKWHLVVTNKNQILIGILVCLVVASPQLLYWYYTTNQIIVDSYQNPGVGLDFRKPYILEVLFSFRKGWLVYTPIMLFSLLGFYQLYHKKKEIFYSFLFYFLLSFYVISSWTEWWYGAGFSLRPMITLYPILAINMGLFFQTILSSKKKLITISYTVLVVALVSLNQFQWWQFKQFIIHPYLTTKSYYIDSFFKTDPLTINKKLLLVERDFSGSMYFKNKEDYSIIKQEFSDAQINNINESVFTLEKDKEFGLTLTHPFNNLTSKDHIWIVVNFDYSIISEENTLNTIFVATMEREEGVYGYFAKEINSVDTLGWQHFQMEYLTPPIRNKKDILKLYFWNRPKLKGYIKNFEVTYYQRKEM